MENDTTKVCTRCGQKLPITEFYRNPKMPDGYYNQCKKCRLAVQRERRNREKAAKSQVFTPPTGISLNPEFSDKTPRELQNEFRKIANELRARGFNCVVKLTYLQEIPI